jgi:hypothetical protein
MIERGECEMARERRARRMKGSRYRCRIMQSIHDTGRRNCRLQVKERIAVSRSQGGKSRGRS